MRDLIPAPALEALLEQSGSEQAIEEYHRLREMNHLLAVYFLTGKRQTDATAARLRDLVGEIEASPAAHLAWR